MREKGFTLIELLVIIAIIGILASLGLSAFHVYKANAAYAVVGDTMHKAVIALEAGVNDIDNPPGDVALVSQAVGGALNDASANDLLPGMRIPKDVNFRVQYDSGCLGGGCQSAMMQIKHCKGEEYQQYVRFGDGISVLLENIAGEGCG